MITIPLRHAIVGSNVKYFVVANPFIELMVVVSLSVCLLLLQRFANAFSAIPIIAKSNLVSARLFHLSESTTVPKTIILGYKTSDEDDWYDSSYPIPVGRFTLKTNDQNDESRVEHADGRQISILTLPKTKVIVPSAAGSYQLQDDGCYYPIPVHELPDISKLIKTKPKIASKVQLGRKVITTQLNSFQEFHDFLTDDERLTVVKFYAPWCKTCKKLALNLNKVAADYGDAILNRVKVPGIARFAQIEYSPKLERFITEILQIKGVPTVQIYHGTNKIWDSTGVTGTKEIVQQIENWQMLSTDEQAEYSERIDDGVLKSAIENSFFDDTLDFLEEEW